MKKSKNSKIIAIFLCSLLIFQQTGFAQVAVELNIANYFTSTQNPLSADKFRPLHLRYISYDGLNNNFKLLLDKGDIKNLQAQEIESTTKDLLNYFFVGISLPNDTFWVNLRPNSPDNIIDPLLAQTQVGKIFLEADLQLKKDTADATNPGTPEGREYWNKLYQKAGQLYGNQNMTIPTLTRPWIVPDEIVIRESADSAYVYKATLKVMLEQDYLKGNVTYSFKDAREKQLNEYSAQIIRENIIPKLNKEINNAKRYAPLRQVYYSLILAQWFKARHKGLSSEGNVSALIDSKDLTNLQSQAPYSVTTYFNVYKDNFEKGQYDIKEPTHTPYGQVIRSYFSGGMVLAPDNTLLAQELAKPIGAEGNTALIPGTQESIRSSHDLSVEVNAGIVNIAAQGVEENTSNVSSSAQAISRQFIVTFFNLESKLDDSDPAVCHAATNALAPVYQALIEKGNMSLSVLENKLNDSNLAVCDAAINALGLAYTALIEKGKEVSLFALENRLNDFNSVTVFEAANALGPVYAALIEKGKMSLSDLETKLNSPDWHVRLAAANALVLVYKALIEKGEEVSLSFLKNKLDDPDWTLRFAATNAIGLVCSILIEKGKLHLFVLEDRLNDSDWQVRQAAANTLSLVYAAFVEKEKMSLSFLESQLNDNNSKVRQIIVNALGLAYTALIKKGKEVSLYPLERRLYDSNSAIRIAAANALGPVYAALIEKEKMPLPALVNQLDDPDWAVRLAAASALGPAYTVLIEKGKMSLSDLESKLGDPNLVVRRAAAKALGSAYTALIEKGKEFSLSALENKLSDPNAGVRLEATNALSLVYTALIEKGKVLDLDKEYSKYTLWKKNNLPYQDTLINQYLAASNPQDFISGLKREAENPVNRGFDYNNEKELWFVYLGLRVNGINITYEQFKERMNKIAEFDGKHPGYFKQLFTKTDKPIVIDLSAEGVRQIDASNVDLQVFDRNLDDLLKVRQNIDSLDWMNEDFAGSKVFNLRNLYYLIKRQQAQDSKQLKENERFSIPDLQEIAEETMRQELLSNRKAFYATAFLLAKDRVGDKLIGAQCLLLMRDLIISDIMLDDALLQEMHSTDIERKITAFNNFYEDYKNHLPNSLGLKVNKIKGLEELFENFSSGVYTEISKVKTVKQTGTESYRLVETGFLSVFRGMAGITDCSFDMGSSKGDAYTRAMHEDTKYLFVYKGKELKGYIGLMLGQTSKGEKVLVVDTVQSPSLDGETLLGNLFTALDGLAEKSGCIGIALPKDIGPSFNFRNERTIPKMDVYKKATPISVTPLHQESWNYFTDMFGEDRYNSIENGEFVLLSLSRNTSSPTTGGVSGSNQDRAAEGNLENKGVSVSKAADQGRMGGIDFRFLPIVTQSLDNLKASMKVMPQSSSWPIDLTQEWSGIERLVNSGITPSAERLKEYFAASCFKGNLDKDTERIISCISDILRTEEESCSLTDPILKDILVVLGSGRSIEELKLAFTN